MKQEKKSVIDQIIITGVERSYTPEEIKAIEEELFGDDIREHERLKAEGRLHEIVIEDEEEEMEEWDESMIELDDEHVEEAISNALYPDEETDLEGEEDV